MYFSDRKHAHFGQPRWHFFYIAVVVLALLFWLLSELAAKTNPEAGKTLNLIKDFLFLISAALAVFSLLILLYRISLLLKSHNEKLENSVDILTRQNNLLAQIAQAVHLSDAAKEIVFRDTEQMELGEAVLNKLHQHDFESSSSMITAMAQQPKYAALSGRLKRMADQYRSATEDGRIQQIITHIETLFDQRLWNQAAAQIDNLIKTFPHSEKAKAMINRLRERQNQQKRELLAAWDLAVREKNTDRSLEILKELDLYLTPNEALALRESASSVFRTKLHNLGVAFSLAVTEQNWKQAYEMGRQIVQDFPNSRMAAEIRSRMDILAERAKPKQK